MKKLSLIFLLLCSLCFFCCSCTYNSPEQSSNADTSSITTEITDSADNNIFSKTEMWGSELKGFLTYDWLSEYEEYADCGFFNIDSDFNFIDLDDDGTYELLRCMHFNYPQGGHTMYIYDYVDNHVVCLGEIEGGAVADDYKGYYNKDKMPSWLSDNVVDIYRNKSDGTFRYLSRNITCGGRELYIYSDIFSIGDNKITINYIDGFATYTLFSDDATVYEEWYYKIANITTEKDSDWEQYISETLEGYEPYVSSKKPLHVEFDCTKWLCLYSEDKASLENAYDTALSDLIVELNSEIK